MPGQDLRPSDLLAICKTQQSGTVQGCQLANKTLLRLLEAVKSQPPNCTLLCRNMTRFSPLKRPQRQATHALQQASDGIVLVAQLH